jgi:hypothetical protein
LPACIISGYLHPRPLTECTLAGERKDSEFFFSFTSFVEPGRSQLEIGLQRMAAEPQAVACLL